MLERTDHQLCMLELMTASSRRPRLTLRPRDPWPGQITERDVELSDHTAGSRSMCFWPMASSFTVAPPRMGCRLWGLGNMPMKVRTYAGQRTLSGMRVRALGKPARTTPITRYGPMGVPVRVVSRYLAESTGCLGRALGLLPGMARGLPRCVPIFRLALVPFSFRGSAPAVGWLRCVPAPGRGEGFMVTAVRWAALVITVAGCVPVALAGAGGASAAPRALTGPGAAAVGGAWGTAREVPGTARLNKGGTAQVTSVSCPSADNCTAGGFYEENPPFCALPIGRIEDIVPVQNGGSRSGGRHGSDCRSSAHRR